MKWIDSFDLILFDLDGLLVNTEFFHYKAYMEMLKKRGFFLPWSFSDFCKIAHIDDDSLKNAIYKLFPKLLEKEPSWQVLRKEKNIIYINLLKFSKVDLMKGVRQVLIELEKRNKKCCVVTNSSKEMVNLIISKQEILKVIPYWVTREDYTFSKPNPDGYLTAINLYSEKKDKIIGFEDTVKGIKALLQTPALSVLVSEFVSEKIEKYLKKGLFYFKSFEEIYF